MPSISVVLPTIGRSERLRRALESVTSQSYPPHEVVIVCKNQIEEVKIVAKDHDIKTLVINQSGTGLSNARNEGIKASSGELIAFLDDDDAWKKEKIERQVQIIEQTKTDFVFSGIEHINTGGDTINYRIPNKVPNQEQLLTHNAIGAPSTILGKKSCLSSVGYFDESLPSREEWDLYIRLNQQCDFKYIPDPLVIKESHAGSMSRQINLIERDWISLYNKHSDKYGENTKRMFLANYHFALGRMYCKAGKLKKGRTHYRESIHLEKKLSRLPHYFATYTNRSFYNLLTKFHREIGKMVSKFK